MAYFFPYYINLFQIRIVLAVYIPEGRKYAVTPWWTCDMRKKEMYCYMTLSFCVCFILFATLSQNNETDKVISTLSAFTATRTKYTIDSCFKARKCILKTGRNMTCILWWQNIWISLAVFWKPFNVLNKYVALWEKKLDKLLAWLGCSRLHLILFFEK